MELAVCSLRLVLKPDRDSTTNRPSIVTDDRQDLSVLVTRLRVQQVTRVENGFRPNRQSKARQLLRDLNTQRWIVNTQSTGERIDRKYGRFRREPEHGSHLCAGAKDSAQLQCGCLKHSAFEEIGWSCKTRCRNLLASSERVARGRGPNTIQTSRVNHANAARGSLLVSNVDKCFARFA